MSSLRSTNSSSNTSTTTLAITAAAAVILSFGCGIGIGTHWLRLRDRERLRHATSRTKKVLQKSQKAALGPRMMSSLLSISNRNNSSSSNTDKKHRQRIIVIGAGNYGTAMAYTAASNPRNHDVVLFMRDEQQCNTLNETGKNPKYLSQYPLNPNGNQVRGIWKEDDLAKELQESSSSPVVVILSLPCQRTPDWIRDHRHVIPTDALLVSTSKGLYLKTKQLIGHAILDALDRAEQPLAFLSGPGFAEEIVKGFPTSVVVASDQLFLAVRMQNLLSNKQSFRVYTSQDPIGVQLGGALKNPLAVGAGMIAGMGFGINTLSASVTRASRELADLCIAMGGNPKTIDGLSGIGDLMLTCFSSQSRNQRCGQRLMKGESIEDIQKDFTVEGVATADVAVAYAKMCGLELPLFQVVHALIHQEVTPEEAVAQLMARPLIQETTRHNVANISMS
jgi:glycerol-3-phosphate dehydrogenase (NAD+)